jgi:D-inositol-3-phosphate glycosyltransferase
MRSVTLLSVPPQIDSPEKGIVWGADIAKTGFVKALLSHGTSDRYYFLCDSPNKLHETQKQLAGYEHNDRAEVVLLRDYWKLRHIERMVVFNSDPMLHTQASFRRLYGQIRWPVTGVTHSLSHVTRLAHSIQTILSDVFEYDSLVCTSMAGRRAIQNLIASVSGYLERKYHVSFLPAFQLPIIPLGIDTREFHKADKLEARRRCGLPDDRIVFLYVGRFSTRYKADLFPLLLAYSQLLRSGGDRKLTLILAGSDTRYELAPALKKFGDELGLVDNLIILPNIKKEKKHDLYQAADVFVALSDNVQETFGISVIEAMCAGLPVIGSDWSGYKESIRQGETGFLVPVYWADAADAVSRSAILTEPMEVHRQLAQTVCVDLKTLIGYVTLLSKDESLRQRMGAAARERALNYYDWSVVVRAYEELWDDMIERARSSSVPEESEHGVCSYDYVDVFKHFATAVVSEQCSLTVAPMGRDFLDDIIDTQVLRHTELLENLPFVHKVLSNCRDNEGIQATELIQLIAGENEPASSDAFQRLASLIKYGLLDVMIPDQVD